MPEPLELLLLGALKIALAIAEPIGSFFLAIFSFDKSLGENSRLGESPLAHEARRDWLRLGIGCFFLVLVVVVGGALVWWSWG